MAQTYTRQSSFSDGDTITAALFNDEYNQLVNAFAYSSSSASSTGHRHDGTAGQGGNIHTIGDLDFLNKIVVDSTNNRWGFYVEVSSAAVEQIRLQDGALLPVTDSDVDLGTSSLYFKDAYIDSITTTGNVAVGGNLTVTGTTTFNGGTITMGDAADDNVVFGADVNSNIIPNTDNTYDLGSSSQEWKDLYVDGVAYLDGINFNGTAITSTAAELNILDGVTSTAAELNILDGVTSTTAELNILDGVTATATELNLLDGVTSTTDELNILDGVTSTAAELNILDGVTATTAELNILDGVTSTTAELNILDGVTSTAAELNILDGVTSTTAELNILDGVTATAAELNLLDGVTATTAELNILDGVTASATDINLIDGITNGTVIASKAIITDANKDISGGRNITITGELDAATLDISGDADIDGTLEADAITIGGVTLAETISDTVGAMVTSNTETGIAVTYDDSDNTLDFVIGTLNQNTTGNAATATALETARTIHGVSFDGTANIDLSEVVQDTVGAMFSSNTETNITATYQDSDGTIDLVVGTLNQDTTGNAATATALETARTIHGVSFDGTANIDLSEVIQDTVGAMVSSNTESGITVAYEDSDGTLDFTVGTLNQDTTGNAATATALETARTIHGVSFDGTANIDLTEVVQDTVGAMFSSNTESGITATYQDSDGTIDLTVTGAAVTSVADADSDTKIQVEESSDEDKIRFDTGGTERMILDSNGLQINTASVANLLIDNSSDVMQLKAKKDGTDDVDLAFLTQASGGTLSEKMRINGAGSIGIGVADGDVTSDGSAARTYVAIIGNANRGVLSLGSTSSAGADGGKLEFVNGANSLCQISGDANSGSTTAGAMNFFSSTGHAMVITSDSKIGIGTTSPAQNFTVSGNGFKSRFDRTGSSGTCVEYANGGTVVGNVAVQSAGMGLGGAFRENDLMVTTNGHVGVGTTDFPSDMANSSYRQFKVGGAVLADSGGGTGSATFLTNNNYVGTGNNMRMDSGGACSGIRMTSGTFAVYTFDGSGGSADAALTQNDRLSIASGGAVTVAGSLSKGSGSFKIDHPLEAKKDTHHLVHSFVEGPQADLIYRGTATLENGTASINLDTAAGMTEGTFVVLNREVQCFTTNETDWDAVKGSVSGNTLTITCQNSSSTATISWLVVGERKDQHMLDTEWTDSQGKVIVEPLKEEE